MKDNPNHPSPSWKPIWKAGLAQFVEFAVAENEAIGRKVVLFDDALDLCKTISVVETREQLALALQERPKAANELLRLCLGIDELIESGGCGHWNPPELPEDMVRCRYATFAWIAHNGILGIRDNRSTQN